MRLNCEVGEFVPAGSHQPVNFTWWAVGAVAIGAIGSYQSARQANKPRSGYTDQTTTQNPYMADTIRPDIEAILNFQRQLINQGPNYVGDRRFWPTSPVAPQPGYAPPPMERTDARNARARANFEAWRAGGGQVDRDVLGDVTGSGGGRHGALDIERGDGGHGLAGDPNGPLLEGGGGFFKASEADPGGAPRERTFGGWTAEELEADPTRVSKLGEPGARKYNRYRRRQGEMGDLSYLRSVFSATGRG